MNEDMSYQEALDHLNEMQRQDYTAALKDAVSTPQPLAHPALSRELALDLLREGHAVIAVEQARAIADALGVTLDESLIQRWGGAEDAYKSHGVFATQGGPGSGVGMLELGYSLCSLLGVYPAGRAYSGRGFQARANVESLEAYYRQQPRDDEGGGLQPA